MKSLLAMRALLSGRSLAIAAAETDEETATGVTVVPRVFDALPSKTATNCAPLASRGRSWPPTELGPTDTRCAPARLTGYLTWPRKPRVNPRHCQSCSPQGFPSGESPQAIPRRRSSRIWVSPSCG